MELQQCSGSINMKCLLHNIEGELKHVGNVDVVLDNYRGVSLKAGTREKRGRGISHRIV